MFSPETVELPDRWPICRAGGCGSRAGVARCERAFGAIAVSCENGHVRGYRSRDEFRGRGRYAGFFSAAAVAPNAARDAAERRLEPGPRQREEVLEEADRCALCGTPAPENAISHEPALRTDRDVWAWLQRWRPPLYARLLEALAIVRRRERVTFGNWRLKIPAALREEVVRELADAGLRSAHVVPAERLAPVLDALTPRELDFAVNRLLIAICSHCDDARAGEVSSREAYLRDYVTALYGGDERRARAGAHWRTIEKIAALCAAPSAGVRSA